MNLLKKTGNYIKKGALVTDASGIKKAICPQLKSLPKNTALPLQAVIPWQVRRKTGLTYRMQICIKMQAILLLPAALIRNILIFSASLQSQSDLPQSKSLQPEEHDRMIAFTSQLPHVLACSYVMSPCCPNHKGFSAGSYRDVSRVANINSKLWSELFLENKEPLTKELDILIGNITRIKDAIKNEDKETLTDLLEQGHQIKKALGE